MVKTYTYQEISGLLEGVDIEVEAGTHPDDDGVRLEHDIISANTSFSQSISLKASGCKSTGPYRYSQRMLTQSLSWLLDGLRRCAWSHHGNLAL